MKCRICGGKGLVEYLNLGEHPPSDAFLKREQLDSERTFPLTVLYCTGCSLSQLSYVVPPEELYWDDYPYETGLNSDGVVHFRKMAQLLSNRFKPNYVVDIGSNDGTLLDGFECKTLGIEPVKEIAQKAKAKTINDFFNENSCTEALIYNGKADVITATNVFAHVDNLHGFMLHVDRLLADNGVFVVEAPYLPDMIESLAFDTIYHEHLSYLSIKPLIRLFREYGMEIFDVEHFDVHCGTMRYYIARRGNYRFTRAVRKYYEAEQEYHDIERLYKFASAVWNTRLLIITTLRIMKDRGIRIVGVSAPAKGNTLLNYCEIDNKILDYITERSERKIGKYTPGSRIKIYHDDTLIEQQPDVAVILAHNWEDQIKNSLKDYRGRWMTLDEEGIESVRRWAFGASGFSGSEGVKEEGVQEHSGLSCRPDEQAQHMGDIP